MIIYNQLFIYDKGLLLQGVDLYWALLNNNLFSKNTRWIVTKNTQQFIVNFMTVNNKINFKIIKSKIS